jgi:hypothetical protein
LSTKPYLVSCSILKDEIKKLFLNKNFEVVYLDWSLHRDYELLEKALKKILNRCTEQSSKKIVLVYGDYCLGANGEMERLAKEFGVVKVDAVNCIDCLLGGKGKYLTLDPTGRKIFLSPGWIKSFNWVFQTIPKDEKHLFKIMFDGCEGIILLDTLGNLNDYKDQIQNFLDFTGLKIIETRKTNIKNFKELIYQSKNLS